jgi:hypothetical protein
VTQDVVGEHEALVTSKPVGKVISRTVVEGLMLKVTVVVKPLLPSSTGLLHHLVCHHLRGAGSSPAL